MKKLYTRICIGFLLIILYSSPAYSGTYSIDLVKNINPAGSSFPDRLTVFDNRLFFTTVHDSLGRELWVTDGTTKGTQLVKNINPLPGDGSNPIGMIEFNGLLYFTAFDGNSRDVWVTDGTAQGTEVVVNVYPGGDSRAGSLTKHQGKLYFSADDGTNGIELWATDGTMSGTFLVDVINPGNNAVISQLTPADSLLFFVANDGVHSAEVWASNGVDSCWLVKNINPNGSSMPAELTAYKGQVFFRAFDGVSIGQLWVSDGTEAGTKILKELSPGGFPMPSVFTVMFDKLFFRANDGTSFSKLWVTDGTEAGTRIFRDIHVSGNEMIQYNHRIHLRSRSSGTNWLTSIDSTGEATAFSYGIHQDPDANLGAFVIYDERLFFRSDHFEHGYQMWYLDEDKPGVVRVMPDFISGESVRLYTQPVVYNDSLYFRAEYHDSVGYELYRIRPLICHPPQQVSILNAEHDNITIAWENVIYENGGYRWEMYFEGTNPDSVAGPIRSGNIEAGDTSVNILNLAEKTSYDFYIKSRCDTIYSDFSEVTPIMTTEDPDACHAPDSITVLHLSDTTTSISWNAQNNETGGYYWELFYSGANPDSATALQSGTTNTGDTLLDISGLDSTTAYDIYIHTLCDQETGFPHEPYSFTTLSEPAICNPPENVTLISMGSNSVTIAWETTENADNGYKWALYPQSSNPHTDPPLKDGNLSAGDTIIALSGLAHQAEYTFIVNARCKATLSEPSDVFHFTTKPTLLEYTGKHFTLQLYPNPVRKELTIESDAYVDQVRILHISGREIIRHTPAEKIVQINVSGLAPGLYLAEVTVGEAVKVFRVIVEPGS